MYICLCEAITKKQLCLLIKEGHCSFSKLQKACKIGLSCGTCVKETCRILRCEVKQNLEKNMPNQVCTKTAVINNSDHQHQQLN